MASWPDVGVELVRSTPKLLLSFVIIIFVGILVAATSVGCVAAINGRAVNIFGFKIEEYKSPEVQKCLAMIDAVRNISDANADALAGIREQITQSLKIKSQLNNNISFELSEQIGKLMNTQEEILSVRNRAISYINTSCGINKN